MQRNSISIEVLTLYRKEWILFNPIDPRKHEKVSRACSFIYLQKDCFSSKMEFLDASIVRVESQEVLMIKLNLHVKYLTRYR